MATVLQSRTTKSLRKTEYRLDRQSNAIQEEYLRRHYERNGGKPETKYEVALSITYLIMVNAESEAQAEWLVQEFPLEALDYIDTTDLEVVSVQLESDQHLATPDNDCVHVDILGKKLLSIRVPDIGHLQARGFAQEKGIP